MPHGGHLGEWGETQPLADDPRSYVASLAKA
jgi:hypothetical protein